MLKSHLHRMTILDDLSLTVTSKGMYDRHIPALFRNRVLLRMQKVRFVTKQYGSIFFCIPWTKLVKQLARMQIVKCRPNVSQ